MKRLASIAVNSKLIFVLMFLVACENEQEPSKKLSISGLVTRNGTAIVGIQMHLNSSASFKTGFGPYKIPNLDPGTYVIKPYDPERSYSPPQITVVLTDSDSEDNNFFQHTDRIFEHRGYTWDFVDIVFDVLKANTSSAIQIDLTSHNPWRNGTQGGFIFTTLTGDFSLAATVKPVKKSDNSQAADCDCLAGLMVRDPFSGEQNYVNIVAGIRNGHSLFEINNTTNNVTNQSGESTQVLFKDFRVRRVGKTLKMEAGGGTWTYDRTDMPEMLQVGLVLYRRQNAGSDDLSVIYENIIIE